MELVSYLVPWCLGLALVSEKGAWRLEMELLSSASVFIYLPFRPFIPSAMLVGVVFAFLIVLTKCVIEINPREKRRKCLFGF